MRSALLQHLVSESHPGVQNDSFLVNTVEIPTIYLLLTDRPTDALAAQMMLMTLTRMFDASHMQVSSSVPPEEDWTHSSVGLNTRVWAFQQPSKARRGARASPRKDLPNDCCTGIVCFVSAPPQRGPTSAEEGPGPALDAPRRGPAERSPVRQGPEASGESVAGRLSGRSFAYNAIQC